MTKRLRETVIERGVEMAGWMTTAAVPFKTMTDENLTGCIRVNEEALEAAKLEQARRLSKVFLPPDAESPHLAKKVFPRKVRSVQEPDTEAALAAVAEVMLAMDDVTLAIYIQGVEKMITAMKQEQARRL